nr:immunoglobulin light chain junction region [Macaca mulatta]MOW36425.1 immunoglobulin light chain junction region [Macaca mulatta]MOW36503.1 immunoglobulin light chain junction region [Macaca mulatta]MOW36822.1 immunoglobulin light chain junction region [Macaca mulatta]MOW36830.1 immunoglobulin light chain junction region [Macaca mulatta]
DYYCDSWDSSGTHLLF